MAQGVIGSLRVAVGMDSAKFTKGARGVENSVKRLGQRFRAISLAAASVGAALSAIAIKAGASIDSQAKLAQSLGTTVTSIKNLERAGELAGISMSGIEQATRDLTRRLSQAATGTGPAIDALDRLNLSADSLMAMPLDKRIETINQAMNEFVPAAQRAAVASKLFGDRGAILAIRLQPDVIQQATQEIERMGLAISEVDADRIEKANDQISGLGLVAKAAGEKIALSVLPVLGRMAEALTRAFETGKPLRRIFDLLVNNIERLTYYVGTFVTLVGARYVTAFAAARIATLSLSGGLAVLKGAIARTGIGLIAIGLAEAVLWFSRLAEVTGGIGPAFEALGNLAAEVFDRVANYAKSMGSGIKGYFAQTAADIVASLSKIVGGLPDIVNRVIGAFSGAYKAVVAVWNNLPKAFKRLGALAINQLVTVIEGGIGALYSPINAISDFFNLEGIQPPDLSGWKQEVGDAVSVAGAAGEAFREAFDQDYVGNLSDGIEEYADSLSGVADSYVQESEKFAEAASRPIKSLEDLKGATKEVKEAADESSESFDKFGKKTGGAAAKMKAATKSANELGKKLKGFVVSAVDGVSDAFAKFVVRGFKDFKGFVNEVLGSFKQMLVKMIAMAAKNRIMVSLGLSGGGAAGGGVLGGVFNKVLGSFSSGKGILGGLGMVLKGFSSGGIGGAISGIGSALGGGLTSAIGGLLPVIGIAAAAFSFFKVKTKLLDSGLRLTIKNTDALTESFKKVQKSRFWGLSKKTYNYYNRAGEEIASPIQAAYTQIRESTIEAAKSIGVSADVLNGYTKQVKVTTKGLNQDQALQALQAKLGEISDDLALKVLASAAPSNLVLRQIEQEVSSNGSIFDKIRRLVSRGLIGGLREGILSGFFDGDEIASVSQTYQEAAEEWAKRFIRQGETASDALKAMSQSLSAINGAFDTFGLIALEVSVLSADAARTMIDSVGGVEAFSKAADHYFQKFYSIGEQATEIGQRFSDALSTAGINTIPDTIEEFRSLVESLNAAGENELAVKLISLSPLFTEWKRLQEQAKKATSANTSAFQGAYKMSRHAAWRIVDLATRTGKAWADTFNPAIQALKQINANDFVSLVDYQRAQIQTQNLLNAASVGVKEVVTGVPTQEQRTVNNEMVRLLSEIKQFQEKQYLVSREQVA